MKKKTRSSGFALVATLVLMALIVTVVVAYLANTRTDRSTSSSYANRLRAKVIADGGLTAATNLLYQHTKTGNYITAMPAQVPTPSSIRTEIYRPQDSAMPDDYLRLDNAIGDVLASRADPSALPAPTPQVDPRPAITPIPVPGSGSSFGIQDPGFTAANSYDFNQVVRIALNNSARLVSATAPVQPAFGQWVRVRNAAGELIGRYAFFIEDESMKVNLDATGNTLGAPNLRLDDTVTGATPPPIAQIQEIDPTAILPGGTDRAAAMNALVPLGNPGQRLHSKGTTALLDQWGAGAADSLSELITSNSKDDDTTARGWQRLNLNKVVAEAADPAAAARTIGDWIVDAWTGPILSSLQVHQMYNDERLRMQIAANIVDYIDEDDVPTEALTTAGAPFDPPVLGIEKIPYLTEVDAVYKATTTGAGAATVTLNFRFKFQNLFDRDLPLEGAIRKIRVKGAPAVIKNNATVFDPGDQWFEFAVPSTGLQGNIGWGPDQSGRAGAKTFVTPVVLTRDVTYTTAPSNTVARFEGGALMEIEVLGEGDKPLDVTKINLADREAKFQDSTPALTYDFLEKGRQAASISVTYELVPPNTTIQFGDPRYRPAVITKRWYNISRTDEKRVETFVDEAEQNSRTFAVDWYDYFGNRPFLFHRNGPIWSVGELGNVSANEYPWRTLYFQHPDRPVNTTQAGPATAVPLRRSSSVDYVLPDLFTVSDSTTRLGALNINTQQRTPLAAALQALFFGVPVGAETLTAAAVNKIALDPGALPAPPPARVSVNAVANRRSAVGPPPENDPKRPYFSIGELAPVLSRLTSWSNGVSVSSRSAVSYTVLAQKANHRRDTQVEQAFRKVSSAITTRGNVFRVLFVGQAIKDINNDGIAQSPSDDPTYRGPDERVAEYLGEAILERQAVFANPVTIGGSSVTKTSDSRYRIVSLRTITE